LWKLYELSPIARSSFHPSYAAKIVTENAAKVIDGKEVAKQIRKEIAVEILRMKDAIGVVPGLAVILVGDRKDSATYVRNKKKACEAVGINSFEVHLPENSTEQEVLDSISKFNEDPSVHGILVQLPLPSVRCSEKFSSSIHSILFICCHCAFVPSLCFVGIPGKGDKDGCL